MLRRNVISVMRSAFTKNRRKTQALIPSLLKCYPFYHHHIPTSNFSSNKPLVDRDSDAIENDSLFDDDDELNDDHGAESFVLKEPVIDEFGRSYGTGRRKTSVARVWIKAGSGEFIVNHKEFVHYFQPLQRMHALEVFQASRTAGHFDVWCTVKGGGMSGKEA